MISFIRRHPEKEVADQLRVARLELLAAEAHLENAQAHRDLLVQRCARLSAQVADTRNSQSGQVARAVKDVITTLQPA